MLLVLVRLENSTLYDLLGTDTCEYQQILTPIKNVYVFDLELGPLVITVPFPAVLSPPAGISIT